MKTRRIGTWILIGLYVIKGSTIGAKETPFVEKPITYYGEDTVHRYTHQVSGLEVMWIENEDTNKSFTLGVKTPTTDSTGVNHIIEHTVFTGSKKYPSATLFFDASSQYPHLFMNAMTSSDLTMYPFATSYDESYLQLMSIYLDSILNPNMLHQPHSFYEESFYYNPSEEKMGGVVFNEMRGAATDPERTLFRMIRKGFYSGTHYANDSGGDITEIPTLTYEHFVDTYNDYYYPENMMIVLYGDIPIQKTLKLIDTYFGQLPLSDKQVEVNVDSGTVPATQALTYEGEYGSQYLVKAFRFKDTPTIKEEVHMDLWFQTYVMDKDSAFTKQLEDAGVKQLQFIKDGDLEKPFYAIIASNGEEDIKVLEESFSRAFKELLIVKKDVNRERDLLAREKMRGIESTNQVLRGIEIAQDYIDEWSHHKPAHRYFERLDYIEQIEAIPDCKDKLFFEMESTLLHIRPTGVALYYDPKEIMAVEEEAWQKIVVEMEAWQQADNKSQLPAMNTKDLLMESAIKPKVTKHNDVTYMTTETDAKQEIYRLYIPTGMVEQSQLPYLFLYAHVLQEVGREVEPYKGEVQIDITAVEKEDVYTPYLKIAIKPVEGQDPRLLWDEIRTLAQAKDDGWYKKNIELWQGKFKNHMSSDILGMLKTLSYNSQTGSKRYLYESTYPLYSFCKDITEENVAEHILYIKDMDKHLVFTEAAAIGIVGDKDKVKEEKKQWQAYVRDRKVDEPVYNTYELAKNKKTNLYHKEGEVDYLMYSYDKEKDFVDGKDYVMSAYLTNYFLQPAIRMQKGAYGAGMYALYPNNLLIYTYRDPDFKSSMEVIETMVSKARKGLDKEKLHAAQVEALGQVQNQFRLTDTEANQIDVSEKLILGDTDMKIAKALQKEIVEVTMEELDEKLALVEYLIRESHISLCTDRGRLEKKEEK